MICAEFKSDEDDEEADEDEDEEAIVGGGTMLEFACVVARGALARVEGLCWRWMWWVLVPSRLLWCWKLWFKLVLLLLLLL